MKARSTSSAARRRGIIAPLVAVALVAVLAIAALALDGGRLLDARRHAKASADAAARSAAIEMLDMKSGTNTTATTSSIRSSAFQIASVNGYTNDGTNSIVTVNVPPTSGAYVGQDGYIEVIIESRLERGFSRIFGSAPVSVVGRSVAVGTFLPTTGSVLVLNTKKKNALAMGKNTSTLKVNGDVVVNSRSKSPMSMAKGSQIEADNVILAGSLDKSGAKGLRGNIIGELTTRAPITADPLKGLPVPSPGTSRKLGDYKTSSGGKDTYNLQPGRYTEDWKFDSKDVVNLAPGTYYIDKKNVDIKDKASIYGDGVTIYSAGNKELRIHTTGDVHLSPPTDGTYAGISIFKDPTAKGRITFEKDANLDISGTIYAPSSLVRFQRTSTALGDDDDTSIWDDLAGDLDDAASGDSSTTTGSMGASIIADMLKIDEHSTVILTGESVNYQRPILGLVE